MLFWFRTIGQSPFVYCSVHCLYFLQQNRKLILLYLHQSINQFYIVKETQNKEKVTRKWRRAKSWRRKKKKSFLKTSPDIIHTLQRRPLHFQFLSLGKNYYKIILSIYFYFFIIKAKRILPEEDIVLHIAYEKIAYFAQ